jgi:hypothetical protein
MQLSSAIAHGEATPAPFLRDSFTFLWGLSGAVYRAFRKPGFHGSGPCWGFASAPPFAPFEGWDSADPSLLFSSPQFHLR